MWCSAVAVVYLSVLSIYLFLYVFFRFIYLSVCLPIYLSIYLSVCLSIYLSANLKTKLFCETSSTFELDNVKKRNKSARTSSILNLTTSRTKQFCETSSILEIDNIKNETILRGALRKWKVECRADGLVPMRFAIFPLYLSKVLRLPRKSEARSYEVLHLSRKIMFPKLKIWCSKMQPLSENQRPDLLTSLMNMSLVLRLPREMHPDPLQMSHACHRFWKCHKPLRFCSLLTRCTIPCACHAKRRRNVQKWSVHVVLVTFWLRSALRATTACTFSTCQLPKVLRDRQFFNTFDLQMCFVPQGRALFQHLNLLCMFWLRKCASRHNGVQLSISHLARWLRTRRFSEPTFRPSGATNYWKNTVSRDFPTFSRTCIFFLLTLSLLWSSLFFSSLLFSDSSHLCFSICPYCRKFDF